MVAVVHLKTTRSDYWTKYWLSLASLPRLFHFLSPSLSSAATLNEECSKTCRTDFTNFYYPLYPHVASVGVFIAELVLQAGVLGTESPEAKGILCRCNEDLASCW